MISTKITITKFNGMNYTQWAMQRAPLLERKQLNGIIKGYDNKPEESAEIMTATEMAASKDWMNCSCVTRSTTLLHMQPTIEIEYTVIDDACKGTYTSLRLRTDIDGNWVDTVANVDSSDSICKSAM